MAHTDFNYILNSLEGLSPEQMRQLRQQIDRQLAQPKTPASAKFAADAEETAYDLASRVGLIGCIKSAPRSPSDLATNPKHMEGFGRD